MAEPKIITRWVGPPVPWNDNDWQAAYDDYEPGDPLGYGATEAAAVQDLRNQCERLES
jgi:hypothetical protein